MDRDGKLNKLWRRTAKNEKATVNGLRHILVTNRDGSTRSVVINRLSDEELDELLKHVTGKPNTP